MASRQGDGWQMAEMTGNPACIWGNMPEISAAGGL